MGIQEVPICRLDDHHDLRTAVSVEDAATISIPANQILVWPLVCCGCGLSHNLEIEVEDGMIKATVMPNEELTEAAQDARRKTGETSTADAVRRHLGRAREAER